MAVGYFYSIILPWLAVNVLPFFMKIFRLVGLPLAAVFIFDSYFFHATLKHHPSWRFIVSAVWLPQELWKHINMTFTMFSTLQI
jgi:hypothetical protein